jgi:hypothetical protein
MAPVAEKLGYFVSSLSEISGNLNTSGSRPVDDAVIGWASFRKESRCDRLSGRKLPNLSPVLEPWAIF